MIETFIMKGYKRILDGIVPDAQTNLYPKEEIIAMREFNDFPTDEEKEIFRQEFNPTRCEIVKNYS